MKFVVIGGDAAGMSAASRGKRHDPDMDVVVFERTHDVSYSACGMPYNIADPDREMDDLVVRSAEAFRTKHNIDLRPGHNVEKIDPSEKAVFGTTSDGGTFEARYDKLLIATGARAILPNIPGVDLPGVFGLKSLQDGRRIKNFLADNDVREVLIVGMGYIGQEMAEAFYERDLGVTMVKRGARILPWLPEESSSVVKAELEEKGVRLTFNAEVERIEKTNGRLRASLTNGETTETDLILFGIGVKPNSELAEEAGIELGPARSIAVDKQLRTSKDDIFSAGDCADAFHVVTGRRVWIPLALRANRAGWAVADNVMGKGVELPGVAGTAVFKSLDLEVARTGLSVQEARREGFDAVETVIRSRSRAHAHPGSVTIHVGIVADKKTGRLLGATLVGKEGCAHRVNAVAVALQAGMTVPEFVQCDLAYAPPFSPVWDPLLTACNQAVKQLA